MSAVSRVAFDVDCNSSSASSSLVTAVVATALLAIHAFCELLFTIATFEVLLRFCPHLASLWIGVVWVTTRQDSCSKTNETTSNRLDSPYVQKAAVVQRKGARRLGRKTGRRALVMCKALALAATIDSLTHSLSLFLSPTNVALFLHFQKLDNDRTSLYIQISCRNRDFCVPRAVVRINQTRNDSASNGELTNRKHAPTVFAVFDCRGQSFVIVGLLDKQIERQHVVNFFFLYA
jgi:hypothetical protein